MPSSRDFLGPVWPNNIRGKLMTSCATRNQGLLRRWRSRLRRIVDRLSVVLRDRHTASPVQFGDGQHDCALSSLYWAVPAISESDIVEAFYAAADTWPYGGVWNKEFAVALKCLKVDSIYSTDIDTLGALLATKPARCAALLPGHFIPIVDGMTVGRDAYQQWPSDTRVCCYWTFTGVPRHTSRFRLYTVCSRFASM